MKMKSIIRQFNNLLLLSLLVVVLLFRVQVFAYGESCTTYIPVEIEALGDSVPLGIEYKIVIKSEKEENPMPDIKEITIKDNGKAELGPMTYSIPGTYNYSVYQEVGTAEHLIYDSTVYTVTVCIVNDENGGLKPVIFAQKEGAEGKVDKIIFTNSYDQETVPAETTEPAETPETTTEPAEISTPGSDKNIVNAPKTGDRIISALFVGIIGISMFILSIILYKKKSKEE